MLSDLDHANASDWFRRHIGVSLSPDKKYLVETRLEPVAFEYGFGSIQELLQELTSGNLRQPEVLEAVFAAITTHETSFFRDFHPFEFLKEHYLPRLVFKNQPDPGGFSVWSAACSSGQEIYSLLMVIAEYFPTLLNGDVRVDATDIAIQTLKKAQLGEFNQSEIGRGLQARLLLKYFTQVPNGNWQIRECIRHMVRFECHNLVEDWSSRGMYDLIMMRNVLIYFDVPLKQRILQRVKRHLKPGGVLMLGSAETTSNLDQDWLVHKQGGTVFYTLDPW
jgi:chemotaxis protein methyltransferase CheR